MKPKILVIDGSRKLHIDNTLAVLADVNDIRQGDLHVDALCDLDFVDRLVRKSYDASRRQANTHEMIARLSMNDFLHLEKADTGKIIIVDEDLFSPGLNWCFGMTSTYSPDNRYVLVSTKRLQNEVHAQHVLRHEVGHMFGAPNPERQDVYESLGSHCGSNQCVMRQELSDRNSFQQAMDAYRKRIKYCPRCQEDIRRY